MANQLITLSFFLGAIPLAALVADSDLSVTELSDRARFVVLAGREVGAARQQVTRRDREFAEREQERVVATRDVRTFELLNERAREEQRATQKTAEQRAADDVASARGGRK